MDCQLWDSMWYEVRKRFALKRIQLTIQLVLQTGEGNGTPLQYSCLENPMDKGAWQAAVHGVAKSRTQLSNFTFIFHFHALEKEMATHSSAVAWRIPGRGSLVGCRLWGHTESDMTEATQQQQQQCIYVSPHLPIHPMSPSPFDIQMFVLWVCVFISALPVSSSIPLFQMPHMCINKQYLSFYL